MTTLRLASQIVTAAFLPALLTACSSTQRVAPVTPAAGVSSPQMPVSNKPTIGHFETALDLLQNGQPQQAEVELRASLKESPDNRAARSLMSQIETPLNKLFPAENFSIELSKDESLSSLAKLYLGDPLQFYALARYNGIPVPAKVNTGQIIKIPRTPTAIAAQQARDVALGSKAAPVLVVEPKPKPDLHKVAEREYKRGLVAFQRQDLDAAIAAWDKVLTIDPNYKDAQLNRAQALRLKENLKKLQH